MDSTHTATVTVAYVDTLTEGVGGRVTVRGQYLYCHSYTDMLLYETVAVHLQYLHVRVTVALH